MGDFIENIITGTLIVSAIGIIVYGGVKPFEKAVTEKYNSVFEYDSAYSKMINLADKKELHPTYGNNNNFFDKEEFKGVAKDLEITLSTDKKIPYKYLEQYIEKYEKQSK